MSLHTCSLNSGSNGNCYYIGNDTEAVLIDAGLSCRETEKRMRQVGLPMDRVKALFISHEHSDHIRGIEVLSQKYKLPVYISKGTLLNSKLAISKELLRELVQGQPVVVNGLLIAAFKKIHDAADPHSFVVSGNGVRIGVFTDIGAACTQLTEHFGLCHAAYLESNYDSEMLEHGPYPIYLKNRIRGGQGHLSNTEALELFMKYRTPQLSHLFLSHLSKDNNCPIRARQLFAEQAGSTAVIVASRYEPTAVYEVKKPLLVEDLVETSSSVPVFPLASPSPGYRLPLKKKVSPKRNQLSLF